MAKRRDCEVRKEKKKEKKEGDGGESGKMVRWWSVWEVERMEWRMRNGKWQVMMLMEPAWKEKKNLRKSPQNKRPQRPQQKLINTPIHTYNFRR